MGEHLNTRGLNGAGKTVEGVANHALLVLAGRVMAVVGVPLAGLLFMEMRADLKSAHQAIQTMQRDIAVMQSSVRLNTADRYTGADATRDQLVLTSRFDSLVSRVSRIERLLDQNNPRP